MGCTGDGYSVTVNGTLYNEANASGSEVLTNAAGCDSTVTVTLTYNATSVQVQKPMWVAQVTAIPSPSTVHYIMKPMQVAQKY